jgi:hypothetical protein
MLESILTEELSELFYKIVTCENQIETRKLLLEYSEKLLEESYKEFNRELYEHC